MQRFHFRTDFLPLKATSSPAKASSFSRISQVLEYIHAHLDLPLAVDDIAARSCWSRWQLQRVFQNEIGVSVGQYIRELKLSGAAEQLLDSNARSIDIAFEFGFGSEISFSRAFRHMFGISPRAYRKAGQRTGLRKPIAISHADDACFALNDLFVEVRVESLESFTLYGISSPIQGLFAKQPDFALKVPQLWQQMLTQFALQRVDKFGVIDVTDDESRQGNLVYWAAVNSEQVEALEGKALAEQIRASLSTLQVPTQTYAVVKHRGPVSGLPKTLLWFLLNWLPQSGYRGIDGFELERYRSDYQGDAQDSVMEYWLPIEKIRF